MRDDIIDLIEEEIFTFTENELITLSERIEYEHQRRAKIEANEQSIQNLETLE